jgi:hypothetical protein
VLGPRTYQLNGDLTYPETGLRANQLVTLNHPGFFSETSNDADVVGYPKSVPVDDVTAPLEHRVRSYLDVNCAHSHQPGGNNAHFVARLHTPLVSSGLINGPVFF